MSGIVTVYAIFGSAEEARAIGRAMVERRLAACVNVLPGCRSIFEWQGELGEEDEVPALFKTTQAGAEALVAAIADAHSYEVPAICVWPIERTLPAYADWVADQADGAR